MHKKLIKIFVIKIMYNTMEFISVESNTTEVAENAVTEPIGVTVLSEKPTENVSIFSRQTPTFCWDKNLAMTLC